MKARIIIGVIVVLVILGGIYYAFTATKTQELDEASPLDAPPTPQLPTTQSPTKIDDALDSMDSATREKFEAEVAATKDDVKAMSEAMPATTAQVISQGVFQRRAHAVAGTAQLIEHDGEKILRFEDFETINGPNLHIYLAADLGGKDFIDLGPIRATKGNVNYEVDANVDTAKYNKVLVWCVPFKVTFSYAELQ